MSDTASDTTFAPSTQRRRGPAMRRHIQTPDDELVPRDDLSAETGMSPRSGARRFKRVVYIAGVAYVPRQASLRDLAGQVRNPDAQTRTMRRGRRPKSNT